jgi:hypothetical protein
MLLLAISANIMVLSDDITILYDNMLSIGKATETETQILCTFFALPGLTIKKDLLRLTITGQKLKNAQK